MTRVRMVYQNALAPVRARQMQSDGIHAGTRESVKAHRRKQIASRLAITVPALNTPGGIGR